MRHNSKWFGPVSCQAIPTRIHIKLLGVLISMVTVIPEKKKQVQKKKKSHVSTMLSKPIFVLWAKFDCLSNVLISN